MPAESLQSLPLRERKKERTRRDLAAAALRLFVDKGYDGATLDELVESVEVSKRTFFRYFNSKEEVAVAAETELWEAYVESVRHAELSGTVLELLRRSLLSVVEDMPSDWYERYFLTRGLIARTPALVSGSVQMASRSHQELLDALADRLGLDEDDMRLRIAVDTAWVAYRCGAKDWISDRKRGGRKVLTERIRAGFDSVEGALVLPARAPAAAGA